MIGRNLSEGSMRWKCISIAVSRVKTICCVAWPVIREAGFAESTNANSWSEIFTVLGIYFILPLTLAVRAISTISLNSRTFFASIVM